MLKPYAKSVPFTVTRVLSLLQPLVQVPQCPTQQKLNAAAGPAQSQTSGPPRLTSLPPFIRSSSPKAKHMPSKACPSLSSEALLCTVLLEIAAPRQ